MNFTNLSQLILNDWDGAPQRMMISIGMVGAGWGGVAMTHGEFNMWIQTTASSVALFIIIWNFWGSVKEKNRKKAKEKSDNKYGNTL
jgi:hypothetical protein